MAVIINSLGSTMGAGLKRQLLLNTTHNGQKVTLKWLFGGGRIRSSSGKTGFMPSTLLCVGVERRLHTLSLVEAWTPIYCMGALRGQNAMRWETLSLPTRLITPH